MHMSHPTISNALCFSPISRFCTCHETCQGPGDCTESFCGIVNDLLGVPLCFKCDSGSKHGINSYNGDHCNKTGISSPSHLRIENAFPGISPLNLSPSELVDMLANASIPPLLTAGFSVSASSPGPALSSLLNPSELLQVPSISNTPSATSFVSSSLSPPLISSTRSTRPTPSDQSSTLFATF